jgi:hypothetical protein
MKATANYFGFSYADSCELLIGSSFTVEDAIRKKSTRRHGQYQGFVYIPDFDPDCFRYCCSDSSVSDGWYWVSGKRVDSNIIAAKSYIKSTYGNVCGYCVPVSEHTHTCAYVNISHEFSDDESMYAQTGFIMRRRHGDYHTTFGRYAELRGVTNPGIVIDSMYHGSFEGVYRTYELRLDKATGGWTFYDNGLEWFPWPDQPEWVNETGNSVQWSGEIYGRETDMPGTANNPCTLDVCFYKRYAEVQWEEAGFFNPGIEIGGSDLSEWYINPLSQSTVEIYDKKPLP